MDERVEPWRKLNTEELMLLNCGFGEDSWESLGLQWDSTSQSYKGLHRVGHDWRDLAAAAAAFIGRTDAEAEPPVLWPFDAKYWLIGKDSDAGKDWRWEEKGTTEDELVGQHHRLSGHEFE